MAGKCYFELGFCKQQGHFVHLLNRIHRKFAKYSFVSRDSQKALKRHFQIGFANKVFHKKAILLIFYAELTGSVIDVLSNLESTTGPPWLGPEKNFQT